MFYHIFYRIYNKEKGFKLCKIRFFSIKGIRIMSSKIDLNLKFTSLGVSYADIRSEEKEKREEEEKMNKHIEYIISSLNTDTTLLTKPFYLCHINYFYVDNNGIYKPAEIGLCKFNLQEGILEGMQNFIDPGEISIGYKFDATDWSNKSHNIPYMNDTFRKNHMVKSDIVFEQVNNFLDVDGANSDKILFTMPDSLNHNNSLSAVECFITENTGDNKCDIKIYNVKKLCFEIMKKIAIENGDDPQYLSEISINKEFENDTYSCSWNLACRFHEDQDLTSFCSLSITKRWVFYLHNLCSKHLHLSKMPGKNCPENSTRNRIKPKYSDNFGKIKKKPNKDNDYADSCKGKCFKPITITYGEQPIKPVEKTLTPLPSSGYAAILRGTAPPINTPSDFPKLDSNSGGGQRGTEKISWKSNNQNLSPWEASSAWPTPGSCGAKKINKK